MEAKAPNQANAELLYQTSDEYETVLLKELCGKICEIQQQDLFLHLQRLQSIIEEDSIRHPHTSASNVATLSLISKTFLTAAYYGQLANDIYKRLEKPVVAL